VFTINVPNVLTLLRILLVPVLVVALLDKTSDGDVFAAIVFALASLTDAIDGYIARSRNAITLFSLVSLHRLPAWVAMVIVAREFAVTMTRMAAAPTGVVIAANWWGKTKTIVQVATIFFLIAIKGSPLWLDLLTYFMVAITVVSGVDYFFGLRRLLREAEDRRVRALT
jgi:CDP-diacylglycerol---glycerol-3-phosphate 3-phosphatidyltransferase